MIGYSDAELSGRSILEFIASDCVTNCERRFSRVVHREELDVLEAQFTERHAGEIMINRRRGSTIEHGALQYVRAIMAKRLASEFAHEQLADICGRVTDACFCGARSPGALQLGGREGVRAFRTQAGGADWVLHLGGISEGVGQPFHQSYLRAVAERRPIEMDDRYAPWDRWFKKPHLPVIERNINLLS